jgi:hypothetical protein
MTDVHAILVKHDDRTEHAVGLTLDKMHEAAQHVLERGSGRDHFEHLMLAGEEGFFLAARRNVA